VLGGMVGAGGASLPNALAGILKPVHGILGHLGVSFGMSSGAEFLATYGWAAALLVIAFTMPNTQELLARFQPSLSSEADHDAAAPHGRWSLKPGWAVAAGLVAFIGVISITHQSEFLYWQF
jgi:hypothetical protein